MSEEEKASGISVEELTEKESLIEELVEREDAIQAKAESASKQQLKDKSSTHYTCCCKIYTISRTIQ